MKKGKFKSNLIKIAVVLICLCSLTFAMPQKSKGIELPWDNAGTKILNKVYEALDGIVGDLVNLILRVPDGVLHIVDFYVAGLKEPIRFQVEEKEVIYNFGVTPYEIFKSGVYEYDEANDVYITKIGMLDINFFSNDFVKSERSGGIVISEKLAPAISKVYDNIRNLCIIIMMLVLMYIGIKIMISSIAEQQAKYKQLLIDWLVAFSLLFIMHYIMSFIVNINYLVIEMLCNDEGDSYYVADEEADQVDEVDESWTETTNRIIRRDDQEDFSFGDSYLAAIDLNAQSSGSGSNASIINNAGDEIDVSSWGNDGVVPLNLVILEDNDDGVKRIFKLNTLSYIRTVSYMSLRNEGKDDDHKVYLMGDGKITNATDLDAMGYSILYVVLMVEIVMFIVIYIKRVIQLAFLTMVAPLVALMYPIDKIGDGKAQAFNTWFKDYLFGVLIQPMHLLLYTVFIRAAGSLLSNNIVYALAIYAYMIPAEKYFKKLLGFEKSSGVGMGGPLAGALGAGLAMGGLNRLAGIGPGPKGGGKGKTEPRKHKIRKLDPSASGGGAPSSSGSNTGANVPSSAGLRRRLARGTGSTSGLVPGAGNNKKKKPILGGVPRAIGRSTLRGISRAATGGKYESLRGSGAQLAAVKNLVGKGFRGAARVAGAASLGTAGLIAGTASAIVNGNEGDIFKGALIGVTTGNKQFGNAAGWLTAGADSLSGTFVSDLAANNDWVAEKVRVNDAMAQFAPELADMNSADRKKYSDTIKQTAAYVSFDSMDDVKAMTKALEASGNNSADAVDAFNAAKSFGKLDVKHNKDAFMENPDILKKASEMAGGITPPAQRDASSYSNADVANEFADAKRLQAKQLKRQEAELEAERDKKLHNATSNRRKQQIEDEINEKIAELRANQKDDATLLAEAKAAKANADNKAAMDAYAAQLQPQLDILYDRALAAQSKLQK